MAGKVRFTAAEIDVRDRLVRRSRLGQIGLARLTIGGREVAVIGTMVAEEPTRAAYEPLALVLTPEVVDLIGLRNYDGEVLVRVED